MYHDLSIFEVKKIGYKDFIQINGICDLMDYLNKNFWRASSCWSSKSCDHERNMVLRLKAGDSCFSLRYGYSVLKIF